MFNARSPYAPPARHSRRLPALLLALPGLLGLASSALAATLNVTNAGDSGPGSLRAAITAANSGDTIAFDSGTFPANGGTIIALTSGRLAVTKDLTISGPGAGGLTISDSTDGIFSVTGTNSANVTVAMSGLTLANGNGASGTSNGNGGGIFAYNANLALSGCVFSGDTANGGGGAVGSTSSTVSLTGCTLSGNTAGAGGAVSSTNSTVSLTGCTLSGNTAGAGGAISSTNSTAGVSSAVSLTNCTLVGNSTSVAGGPGGGIYNSGSQLTLTNCTLVGNTARSSQTASGQGGGLYNTGTTSVRSSILNGNTAAGGGPDVFGAVTSGGSNIVGDPNGAAYGFTGPHDQVFVNPMLAPGLASNGGPTQTIAVLPGSPAIGGDYANATTTDQRGFARSAPNHTIGASEFKPSHTHLLWNNSDARVMLWSIAQDGSFGLNGFGPYTDNAPGNIWHATAVATGPDGVSHLLWNNTDGRVMLWTVDDAGNFSLAGYGPYTDNAPQNKWSATAVSVGPDNVVHLLWNNTDNRVMLWNVAPDFTFTLAGYGPYTDTPTGTGPGGLWSATALATGPDNVSRIAWNNADGRVMLWDVDSSYNFTLAGYGPYTDNAPQNKWSVTGVSVGADNLTHLLWSNTDRRAMFWNVDGAFNFTLAGYGPYTDNGANNLWSAIGVASGPDGLNHLLWNNTDDRAMLWGVDNAFGFTVAGYGPYTDNYVNNGQSNLWSVTAVSAGP